MGTVRIVVAAVAGGIVLTLLSATVGVRTADAVYPDILGCERGCRVAAAGWPVAFVRDYPPLSVANRATLFDAATGADRFAPAAFAADAAFWALLAALLLAWRRARRVSPARARRRSA